MPDLTAAATVGHAEIKAASSDLGILLETRNRDAEQADPAQILEFKEEAGRALRTWAGITDEKLKDIHQLASRGHGLMDLGEAQAIWQLLDQLQTDVYRYIEDRDSLLEDYEPLQRASAPQNLILFWDRFDSVFNKLDSHKATLAKYGKIYAQQSIIDINNYEDVSREKSREIRNKLREFIDLARPLMQAIGRL